MTTWIATTSLICALAAPPAATATAALDTWIAPLLETRDLAGAVLVRHHGEIVVRTAYGQADVARGRVNRPQTRFAIGSISKQLTAAAVLELWDRGRLRPEDPIGEHLRGVANGERITIHHLLAHRSGLVREVPEGVSGAELAEVVHAIGVLPLAFEPGAQTAYSNAGYVVLAHLVETVTGQRFEEAVRARVLKPLALDDTGWWDGFEPGAGQARGYDPGSGPTGLQPTAGSDARRNLGADGMVSTVDDLAAWADAILHRRLLSDRARAAMLQDHGEGRGYGVAMYPRGGHRVVGHDGVEPGYTAFIEWYPDDALIVAYAGNIRTSAYEYLERALPSIALGIALPAIERPKTREAPADPTVVGSYRVHDQLILDVIVDGDHLALRGTGGYFTPLQQIAQDRYWYRAMYSILTFKRDRDGAVTEMTWTDVHGATFTLPRIAVSSPPAAVPDT